MSLIIQRVTRTNPHIKKDRLCHECVNSVFVTHPPKSKTLMHLEHLLCGPLSHTHPHTDASELHSREKREKSVQNNLIMSFPQSPRCSRFIVLLLHHSTPLSLASFFLSQCCQAQQTRRCVPDVQHGHTKYTAHALSICLCIVLTFISFLVFRLFRLTIYLLMQPVLGVAHLLPPCMLGYARVPVYV